MSSLETMELIERDDMAIAMDWSDLRGSAYIIPVCRCQKYENNCHCVEIDVVNDFDSRPCVRD